VDDAHVRAEVRLGAEHRAAEGAGGFAEVHREMFVAGPARGVAAAAAAALEPRVRPLHREQGARLGRAIGGGRRRCGGGRGRRRHWQRRHGDGDQRRRQRQWQRR